MAFTNELRALGYVDGREVILEPRFADVGKPEQFDQLAADLVRRKVDVIVALLNPEIAAAKRATSTIPIVMVIALDPVGRGFVSSVARPAGNVTGLTWDPDPALFGKSVELIKELLPTTRRIAGLIDVDFPGLAPYWSTAERAAESMGLKLQRVEV